MSRRYELKARAERQEQTRQRIVEAAIDLHQTIGPRATAMSDIAKRAGVGRVTVYRHFPDELALAAACSRLYYERNPWPDPSRWESIADPAQRLRAALLETYAYHRATEPMHRHVLAEGRSHPIMAPYQAHWRHATDVLLKPWKARGRRRQQLRAAIALALSFDTWLTLTTEQGLTDAQAINLVLRLVQEPGGSDSLLVGGRSTGAR
jgi:AcrR family transcriptional regulator